MTEVLTVLLMKLDSEMVTMLESDPDKAPALPLALLPMNSERKIVVAPWAVSAPPCSIRESSDSARK